MALASKNFSDLITFTRASGGGRFNASGQYEWLAANAPRIDYDPITGVCLGILIEEQRTNLLLNSATLATQSLNLTAGTYTLSFYGSGTVSLSGAYSGTVVGSGASTRKTFSFTATAGTLTLTVSGSCTSGQLEAGALPSSYIPTTSAQVTRAADTPSVNTLSPWYNEAEGTLVVEAIAPNVHQSYTTVAQTGNTDKNILAIQRNGQSDNARGFGDGWSLDAGANSLPASVPVKIALAGKSGVDAAISVNGADTRTTPVTGALGTPTGLGIGRAMAASSTRLNGHIKSIRYYPKRLTNAELQAVTA